MPPRKSDASKVPSTPIAGEEGTPSKEKDGVNMEDLNLPKSIVTRLAKGVLPPNTQIQANAVLAMTKSATVFINYLATTANEHTQAGNKKTVGPADVLRALDEIEFGEFKPRLEAELAKFNELATEKRNAYRKRVAAEKAAGIHKGGTPSTATNGEGNTPANASAEDSEPAAKKARLENTEGESGMSADAELVDEAEPEEPDHEHEEGEGEAEDAEEEEGGDEEEAEEGGDRDEKEVDADEALDNGEDSD